MLVHAHIVVQGMVQGVGFRYFISLRAHQYGLKGYTRNLFNGDVEIEVEGERGMVEELIKHVKLGPRFASVKDVYINWGKVTGDFSNFDVM